MWKGNKQCCHFPCKRWVLGSVTTEEGRLFIILQIQSLVVVGSLECVLGIWTELLREKTDQVQSVFCSQMKTRVRPIGAWLRDPWKCLIVLLKTEPKSP